MISVWWNAIPNARKFVDDIAQKITQGESAVYAINSTFPWHDAFVDILKTAINVSDRTVSEISRNDYVGKIPGEYLLEKYCKPELRMKYRSTIPYYKFLAEHDSNTVLTDKIIYVKSDSLEDVISWCDFIAQYDACHGKNTRKCCFIIEAVNVERTIQNIVYFDWNNYFHMYDIYMLCLLVASDFKEDSVIKRYVAELSCSLARGDAELAYEIVSLGSKIIKDPMKAVENIICTKYRSDDTEYARIENYNRYIKDAQVKVFFSEIENFRDRFISEHLNELPANYTNSHGEIISDVHDLELGDLKFLCDNCSFSLNNNTYKELSFFRECRNHLAHSHVLSEKDIRQIITYSHD